MLATSPGVGLPGTPVSDAKAIPPVVSLLNHQTGKRDMFSTVRAVSVGGIVRPFTTSRSRIPETVVSTVSRIVEYPAASARETRSSLTAWSAVRNSWNQRSADGAAARTSSIEVEPTVDSAYGTPTCWATAATAASPWWCIIRV